MSKTYIHEISPDNGTTVLTLKDAEAAPISLLEDTVGWINTNIFDIDDVVMGVDIYGEASANAACFTFDCEGSTDYYLTVNGVNNLSIAYTTSSLGAMQIMISSFPFKLTTRAGDTWVKIEFAKAGLAKSDIKALKFMISEVANAPYSEYHPTVKEELADKASISLLKDTVGWVGKNLLDKSSYGKNRSELTVTQTDTGVRLQVSPATTLANAFYILDGLEKNKDYIVSTDILITSGNSYVVVDGSSDGSTYSTIKGGAWRTSGTASEEISFNVGNYNYIRISFYATKDTSATADITYSSIMLRDASITDSTFEPYHPSVEQCKFDRAEQRVLGAKNLYYGISGTNDVNITTSHISNGYRVILSSAGTYKNAYTDFVNLETNTEYIVTSSVDITSGKGRIIAYGSNDGINFTELKTTSTITEDSNVELSFNTGNYTYIRIRLFATWDLSTTGDVTYGNLMIRLASDPDDTYAPPAKTNFELTESEIPSPTVDGTVITSIRNNNSIVLKGHKIAIINLNLIVGTYANWTTCVSGLPKAKDSIVAVHVFNMDNARIFSGLIDTSGNLKLVALTDTSPLTGHAIAVSACYPYSSL